MSHPAWEEETQPHIVLLSPGQVNRNAVGWGRVKRSGSSSGGGSVGSSSADSNATIAAPSDNGSLTRGYAQNEDFLKDVDIPEENIDNKIQNHNLSISISNVSS